MSRVLRGGLTADTVVVDLAGFIFCGGTVTYDTACAEEFLALSEDTPYHTILCRLIDGDGDVEGIWEGGDSSSFFSVDSTRSNLGLYWYGLYLYLYSYCYKAVELRMGESKIHCRYDNTVLLVGDDMRGR